MVGDCAASLHTRELLLPQEKGRMLDWNRAPEWVTEASHLATLLLKKGRAALFSPGISIQTATTAAAGAATPIEYL